MAKSKGEEEFIEQKTRELLVGWADYCVKKGHFPDFESVAQEDPEFGQTSYDMAMDQELRENQTYWDFALSRGWLTKKTPRTLTSAGWGVAAAFLKR
jgi:hypothetical protein